MNKVFISFSSNELDEATRICDYLESHGLSCFISSRDLLAGEEYAAQLITNLESSSVVVLMLSKASNESPHVLREIEHAVSHKIPVVVYKLEEVILSKSMEYYLMTHQWVTDGPNKETKLLTCINLIESTGASPVILPASQLQSPSLANTAASATTVKNRSDGSGSIRTVLVIILLIVALAILGILVYMAISLNANQDLSSNDPSASNPVVIDSSSQKEESDLSTQDTSDQDHVSNPSTNESSEHTDVPTTESDTDPSENQTSTSIADSSMLTSGTSIQFGSYYDGPITWRVLKKNEDHSLLLVSAEILTMKSFDAAESGSINTFEDDDSYWTISNKEITADGKGHSADEILTALRGNNDWSVSNIRTWLNSSDEEVSYDDQPPTYPASGPNHYEKESGFLYNFTEEERSCILPTQIETPANSLSVNAVNGKVTTTDHVFLLSSDELFYFKEAGIPIGAKPSLSCMEHDKNHVYTEDQQAYFKTDEYYWLLRDSNSKFPCMINIYPIGTDTDELLAEPAFVDNYGIRPAMYVDADALTELINSSAAFIVDAHE